jgi:DNA invertase Pin-like site-specific DNA recombinase
VTPRRSAKIAADVPTARRVIGYSRVSTSKQGSEGLGMTAQRTALEEAAAARGLELVDLVVEVGSGGKKLPARDAVIARIERGEADGMLVAKLDRLSRSFLDFATILDGARRKGWALIVVEPDVDLTTPFGAMFAGILATVAQFEREMVTQRTREARAAAIVEGRKVGGWTPGESKIPDDVRDRIVRERQEGKSLRAIGRDLEADGIKPPRAAHWSAETIKQVISARLYPGLT